MFGKSLVFMTAAAAAAVICFNSALSAEEKKLPEFHTAECRESSETKKGAQEFNHALDHPHSRYYVINDYYNMESGNGLHIISHFASYQQGTEYTCGCAAAITVLNRFGIHKYSEAELIGLINVDPQKGTSVEGLANFFKSIGFEVDYHADTKPRFETIESCEEYLIDKIDRGIPVMVDWLDWAGHWQVVIGIDTCGSESPYDDVLILADPYDVTDHCQDGYYIYPYGRFFDMWREGKCADKQVPYEQPFVVAYPKNLQK
ncbi:hypothetical protein IJT93_00560 [bacterium]|nr:hypothetical protein [bacterium]